MFRSGNHGHRDVMGWVIVLCFLAQSLLAQWLALSWWVPNLVLIGCVFAVTRRPKLWFPFSLLGGALLSFWSVRAEALIVLSYVLVGLCVAGVAFYIHVGQRRVQFFITLAACVAMDFIWVLTERNINPALLSYALGHIAITAGAFFICAWLLERWDLHKLPKHRRGYQYEPL